MGRAPILKIGSNIQQAKELLIQSFLKEGSNPRFDLNLRDFIDNSNAFGPSHTLLENFGGVEVLVGAHNSSPLMFEGYDKTRIQVNMDKRFVQNQECNWEYFLHNAQLEIIWMKKLEDYDEGPN